MDAEVSRNRSHQVIEIEFPAITDGLLEPIIDLLTDLLVNERIREMEHVHSEDGTIVRNKKEQLKASMAED